MLASVTSRSPAMATGDRNLRSNCMPSATSSVVSVLFDSPNRNTAFVVDLFQGRDDRLSNRRLIVGGDLRHLTLLFARRRRRDRPQVVYRQLHAPVETAPRIDSAGPRDDVTPPFGFDMLSCFTCQSLQSAHLHGRESMTSASATKARRPHVRRC